MYLEMMHRSGIHLFVDINPWCNDLSASICARVYRFRKRFADAGIAMHALAKSGFSLARIVLFILPLPFLMARYIRVREVCVHTTTGSCWL
jgi:hypothetical protein